MIWRSAACCSSSSSSWRRRLPPSLLVLVAAAALVLRWATARDSSQGWSLRASSGAVAAEISGQEREHAHAQAKKDARCKLVAVTVAVRPVPSGDAFQVLTQVSGAARARQGV